MNRLTHYRTLSDRKTFLEKWGLILTLLLIMLFLFFGFQGLKNFLQKNSQIVIDESPVTLSKQKQVQLLQQIRMQNIERALPASDSHNRPETPIQLEVEQWRKEFAEQQPK